MTAPQSGRMRVMAAIALQAAALVALAMACLGGAWLDSRARPHVVVLVDRSNSMPRARTDAALAEALHDASNERAAVEVFEFAGAVRASSDAHRPLEPDTTNLEAALDVALSRHAERGLAYAIVISDGFENVGRAERALRLAREAGLPVRWIAVPAVTPRAHIVSVVAPDRARVNQPFTTQVHSTNDPGAPLRVRVSARTISGDSQQATATVDPHGTATVTLEVRKPGAIILDAALEDGISGNALHSMTAAAAVDVLPAARLLYVEGEPAVLARSLRAGGWDAEIVRRSKLDAYVDGLDRYAAVVLDDVAIEDASPRFWRALVRAVQNQGTGLAVIGGGRAFARGSYRESELESLLPLVSEPAARVQPTDIVFAVDKSGSMGQGSGGVNRFQLAQRAVVETVRTLGEQDSVGVLVFDVDASTLVPLGRARELKAEIARDWPVTPNGGTRLAPVLDAALKAFEHSTNARRMLVIVTDGFLDDAPIDELRRRLQQAGIETIAIAVGPDADTRVLRQLVRDNGVVLHAREAAELPLTLRAGVERWRARVERGVIPVLQRARLPFSQEVFEPWPPVAAHAVTRAQPNATVALETRAGDPILAWQRVGYARVVAITTGFGTWAPQWTAWPDWPRFAGALAGWITGAGTAGGEISVAETERGLRLDVDIASGAHWGAAGDPVVMATTPDLKEQRIALRASGPGRYTGWLPDAGVGLYTINLSSEAGRARLLFLRPRPDEIASTGTSPTLDAWRASGLIAASGTSAQHAGGRDHAQPIDRSLIALALVLSLLGVLVDRGMAPWSLLRRALASRTARNP